MKSTRANTNRCPRKWLHCDVTSRSLKVWKESVNFTGSTLDLVNQPMPNPEQFSNPEEFRAAYWKAEVWSKYPFDNIGIDRESAALQLFHEYEEKCAASNKRLADLWTKPIPEGIRHTLCRARALLESLFAGFSADEIVEQCNWGPGASTSMPRAKSSPQNKWVFAAHITEDALPYYYAYQRYTGRIFCRPVVVAGNKVTTVPKNAKTNRTIAIEPDWNMFFQLGLGKAISKRLKKRGLLISVAKTVQSLLAEEGSKSNSLATIDVKGASDCVSLALVEALVPQKVLKHVMLLRSPHGELGGRRVTYEKISSMGNGYTFELETALFWAICTAASGRATVLGDDIIVPNNAYSYCCDVLQFCGFDVNLKKSFYDSPFRESCGGHFFNGVNVTPPYIRKALRGAYRISVCNRIRETSEIDGWTLGILWPLYESISSGIPKFLYGPRDIDGTLWTPLYTSQVKWHSKLQCFTGVRLLELPKSDPAPVEGAYLQALFGVSGFSQWHKAPEVVTRYKTWVSGWHGDFFPWSSGVSIKH